MADSVQQAAPASAPVPGSPEHAQAMIALAESEGVQVRVLDGQGRTVPEAPADEPPQDTPPVDAPTDVPPEDAPTAEDPPASPLAPFMDEFAKTGDISAESRTKLLEETRKMGLQDEFVDAYIAGQKALKGASQTAEQQATLAREDAQRAGFAAAGGEAQYKQMVSWAAANLSPAEVSAFNAQVDASKEAALLAIEGLKARYQRATGTPPGRTLSGGASGPSSNVTGFANQEDVTAAMADPRYRTSATYRQQVSQRLALTNDAVLGIRIR